MAVRNQHPAQLLVQRLAPRSASTTPSGAVDASWSNAYSSYFLSGSGGADLFVMDGELWRSSFAARIGLADDVDLGFEVPLLHASGGFLDQFVIGWHDTFGFADQGRDGVAKDRYEVALRRNGATVWEMEPDGLRLGDLPIDLTWALRQPTDDGVVGFALRAGLELPTGDADRGYGSGGIDVAFGALAEVRVSALAITAQLAWSDPSTPGPLRRAGIRLRDLFSADLGLELGLTDDLALLFGSGYETSALRQLDFARAADDQWLLWVGLRQRTGERTAVEFGIGEDLSRYVAPDFTAWAAVTVQF